MVKPLKKINESSSMCQIVSTLTEEGTTGKYATEISAGAHLLDSSSQETVTEIWSSSQE